MNLLVQTDRILANYRILNKQAGGTPLIPVLEANAYGLGDVAVAKLLAGEGVRLMAVSRLDEAVRVSEAVRGVDVMLLTPYANEEDIATILQHDIIGAVGSNDSAVLYSSLSRKLRTRARCSFALTLVPGGSGSSRRRQPRPRRPLSIWKTWNSPACSPFCRRARSPRQRSRSSSLRISRR